MPRPNMNANYGKAKDTKETLIKLSKYLKPHLPYVIIAIVLSVIGTVCMILGPNYLGQITKYSQMFINNNSYDPRPDIIRVAIILMCLYASSAICNYFCGFFMTGVTQKVTNKMRQNISLKINRLPLSYFDSRSFGDVLSRVTNDIDLIGQNLNQTLSQLISSIIMFIGVFVMMLVLSPTMTLIAVVTIPLSLILMILLMRVSQKYFRAQQNALGRLNGHIEEAYAGQNVIKAFNQEEAQLKVFTGMNSELKYTGWKSQFLSTMMHPIMQFVGNLGYVVISILGGYMVILKRIEVGDILSFTQYVRQFTQQINQLSQVMSTVQSAVAASERVFDFLELEEEVQVIDNALSTEGLQGNITFDHVQFGYNPDKIIIHDFNCKVKDGQKIAIVGPTGAGKTTIVKLLMRFYDLNSGRILIDGNDMTKYNRSDIRKLFGMVLQDTWLFNGTIKDNIKYGKLDASDTEVKDACHTASVDHFIRTLPDGYNMVLNEEADNISGGQKQLLTIARVILADPKILILDEATSSVDTRTEELIQKAMDKLMEGRTSFIIAHRLSTIKNADLILVMNDGDIVEQGNHEELLKKNGFYANLYNSQFEGGE